MNNQITDPTDPMQRPRLNVISGIPHPALARSYLRRFDAQLIRLFQQGKSVPEAMELFYDNQAAELLYLIVSVASEDGLEFFQASDTADTDGDGIKEFLDGWRRPISWIRWPAGYDSPVNRAGVGFVTSQPAADQIKGDANLSTVDGAYTNYVLRFTTGAMAGQTRYILNYSGAAQTFTIFGNVSLQGGERFSILAPDPFDQRQIYPGRTGDFWFGVQSQLTFEVQPLIFSDGPDEVGEIVSNLAMGGPHLIYANYNNNPFIVDTTGSLIGATEDLNQDGAFGWIDNITSHDLTRR